jgi:hypothetical protein
MTTINATSVARSKMMFIMVSFLRLLFNRAVERASPLFAAFILLEKE